MEYLIFDDGENFIMKKKDIKNFLDTAINYQIEEEVEEETINYYKEENQYILEQVQSYADDDLICLYENAMSGWLMIDNTKINDLLEI